MLNNSIRGRNAIITYIIFGVILLFAVLSDLYEVHIISKIEAGTFEGWEVDLTDSAQTMVGFIQVISRILFIIMFLTWLRRAYANLKRIGIKGLEDDGWAVGAWFVPIINLFRPYQIVRDTYVETITACYPPEEKYKVKPSISLISSWWALWLISLFLSRIATRLTLDNNETLQAFKNEAIAYAISDSFDFIPYILLLIIMRRIMKFESILWEKQQSSQLPISSNLVEGESAHPEPEEDF